MDETHDMSNPLDASKESLPCFCPCCQTKFSEFRDWSESYRNVECPNCLSHPRHRLFWLYLTRRGLLEGDGLRVLHFGPERTLRTLLSALPNLVYTTVDRDRPFVDARVDITAIPFPDRCFDVVLCSHVLEHVREDALALREVFRVLEVGGWAWLQVPIDRASATTQEDPNVTSPEERKRLYRESDHLRLYGRDFADRVRAAGFAFVEDPFVRTDLAPSDLRKFGLFAWETLFIGERRDDG
jgi:SAM-dependent methyltransferase